MTQHQTRVAAEKLELDLKLAGLDKFIGGTVYESLDDHEKRRLCNQFDAMHTYSEILGQRIDAFPPDLPVAASVG